MTNIYCTYFNESYLNRGIVLYRSLRKFVPDSILEVLCIDDKHYTTTHVFAYQTAKILKIIYDPYVKSLLNSTLDFNLAKWRPARHTRASFVTQIFNAYRISRPFLSGLKRFPQIHSLHLMSSCGIDTIRLKQSLERLFASRDNNLLT